LHDRSGLYVDQSSHASLVKQLLSRNHRNFDLTHSISTSHQIHLNPHNHFQPDYYQPMQFPFRLNLSLGQARANPLPKSVSE
jgi:hypothetical protein